MATKRISVTLVCLFLMLSAFASNKNLEKDITLVSYEQGWIDVNGTLALKNNTNEDIRNLSFQITYLDMSGNPLDYKDFKIHVSIASGMTRKLDIPSYEYNRNYHYYKSENKPGGSPAFKIKFTLKDYNFDDEDVDDYNSYYSSTDDSSILGGGYYIIIVIVVLLFSIGITVGLYVLVAVMAKDRNRSVVVWILLSLLATPILMIIILLVIGKNERYIDQHYDQE